MQPTSFDNDHPLADEFRDFIRATEFPCVGAKSALSRGTMNVLVGRDITSAWDDLRVYSALHGFAGRYRADPGLFRSVALIFPDSPPLDEETFERNLWKRLQSLTDKDEWLGQEVDPRVSDDPEDPHFSLSFGGEAFFVVGLHPGASRPARRFRVPVLVFNLHDQFEQLRADGRYEKLRSAIIARDVALAGSPNPMLARHGTLSEARQYSGRAVGPEWKCPFSRGGGSGNRDAA
jgi:FPC/CPF motif-containing protein YcgG